MKKSFRVLFPAITLFIAGTALAGGPDHMPPPPPPQSHFYVGAGIALEDTIKEQHDEGVDTTAPATPAHFRQTTYGFGPHGFFGYQFDNHWASEIGFTWIRKTTYQVNAPNTATDIGRAAITHKYFASWVGKYSIDLTRNFKFFVKAGPGWYHKHYIVTFPALPAANVISSLNAFVFVYGAGFDFPIYDIAGVRLQYTGLGFTDHLERFHFVPNLVNVDLYFNFGS